MAGDSSPALGPDTGSLFIDGAWRPAAEPGGVEVIDPTTENVLASVPEATPGEVGAAVDAARRALGDWRATPPAERAARVAALAAGLQARATEIAALVTREVGTPINVSALVHVGLPAITLTYLPQALAELSFEERVGNSLVLREPAGVVAAITPWNYPLHQLVAKVAPALAAGCTVVAKPSELAPLSAFVFAELVEGAALPPGVFNLVTGRGAATGEELVAHPGVDMVSFTGSTRGGRRVAEVAAAHIKRVALELGGKSASVILDDADLPRAVTATVTSAFLNAGQTCVAQTRMLVPRARLGDAEELAAVAAAEHTVGDPMDPQTRLGPLVSEAQRDRVRRCIDEAVAGGARLVAGGSHPPELSRGYFVRPTVVSEVVATMPVAREEVFGPVLAVMAYDGEEEAVEIANATAYGLSGAVWSADAGRAEAVARRLVAGQVEVNGGTFNPLAPFGGCRQSGYGRELGRWGIEEFLETKALQF